jgi:hypothetical protein
MGGVYNTCIIAFSVTVEFGNIIVNKLLILGYQSGILSKKITTFNCIYGC